MKKIIPYVILLTILATNTAIARNYPLTIAGIRVTDTNAANIRGQGITGSVSYNAATRTLTLNNATISYSQHIIDADSTLFIRLVGQNALINIAGLGDALYAKGDTLVIEGPEGSSLNSVIFCSGINSYNGTHLIVRGGCTINAFGHYGITATGNRTREFLTVDNSYVNAAGHTDYSIGGFNNIYYIHSIVYYPGGASYNTTQKRMVNNQGNTINDTVRITNYYPVRVGNKRITKYDADSLCLDNYGTGLVRYIDSSKTLVLKQVNLSTNITCDSNINIFFYDTNIISGGTSSLYLYGKYSTIESPYNSYLQLSGGTYSIYSHNLKINSRGYIQTAKPIRALSYSDTMEIIHSRMSITSTYNYTQISAFSRLILDECAIISPTGTFYDTALHKTANNYFTLYGMQVLIDTFTTHNRIYPILVAGTRVTTENCNNIQNQYITGTVSYDTLTNTLNLLNAQINCPSSTPGIRCDSSINIRFSGTNTINAQNSTTSDCLPILLNGENSTLSGFLSNEVNLLSVRKPAIKTTHNILINQRLNLFTNGHGILFIGTTGQHSTLTIDRANVKIHGEIGSGYISYFDSLILHNCEVVNPIDGIYNTSMLHMTHSDASEIRYDTLIIAESPNDNGVEEAVSFNLIISPNPVSSNLCLSSDNTIDYVEIFDTKGVRVKRVAVYGDSALLDMHNLKNGIYILKTHSGKAVSEKLFVVQH
ncbi:MAG: T9SS type A sorting domain-containing protein [Bacteroidales bacterium]|nr:T9SS type A sorting domain-containing protein [Bacteroidales bacterium]